MIAVSRQQPGCGSSTAEAYDGASFWPAYEMAEHSSRKRPGPEQTDEAVLARLDPGERRQPLVAAGAAACFGGAGDPPQPASTTSASSAARFLRPVRIEPTWGSGRKDYLIVA